MTVIKHKRGSGAPDPSGLDVGELAIDLAGATLYTKIGGSIVELGGGGGTGAGMVISATEPSDKVTGMQWLDVSGDEPYVWIWDDDKWVEFPAGKTSGGSGGTYTLPVAVRGGDIQLPLNDESNALIVDTRSGPVELPLMAA
jgi:hypothetical protein